MAAVGDIDRRNHAALSAWQMSMRGIGMPAISVVVPVYKVEKFLPRCIESVLHQTFQDWELILVDDGSPDRCSEICDAYAAKDSRITVIHQENSGVSAARNEGMKHCAGDYLYFLDADDYLAPAALETMLCMAQAYKADIVMTGHNRVESDGYIHDDAKSWENFNSTKDIQIAILRNRLPNFPWGKLYKRLLWKNVSFPVGLLIEDAYVMAHIFFKAKKYILIENLCIFTVTKMQGVL